MFDFEQIPQSNPLIVVLDPGVDRVCELMIPIFNDTIKEETESFQLHLQFASLGSEEVSVELTQSTTEVFILDNDGNPSLHLNPTNLILL